MIQKERYIFFDILRITAMLMVVYIHIFIRQDYYIHLPIPSFIFLSNTIDIGKMGVIIFILISGSMLYMSTKERQFNFKNILPFYYKKFARIYPTLWLSLPIYLILNMWILRFQNIAMIFIQITGTTVYFVNITNINEFEPLINPIVWFISLIVGLYLLYPILFNLMKYKPMLTLVISGYISYCAQINYTTSMAFGNPLAYLSFFVLGMFIVQFEIYPKYTIDSTNKIVFLSNLSFYIFLIHGAIFGIWNNNIIMFIILTLIISWFVMLIDNKIQSKLNRKIRAEKKKPTIEIYHESNESLG
jgi:peptidoglycan/LPS O-acetylase OafA/YrhL